MKAHPLKIARESRGWSQTQLAKVLGVNTRTVGRWELRLVVPHPHYREQLSLLFGKTIEELGLVEDADDNGAVRQVASPVNHFLDNETVQQVASPVNHSPNNETVQQVASPVNHSSDNEAEAQASYLADPAISNVLGSGNSLLGRSGLLSQVKQHLFEGTSVVLTALGGLPGVGKTALAVALATDKQVRAHFPDGILWARLGQEPKVLGELARWGTLLECVPSQVKNFNDRESWCQALRTAIGTRRLLLVIDDAWTAEDASAFQVGGMQCAYLLTTRLPDVASVFAEQETIIVPQLEEADALTLLARYVPLQVQQDPKGARSLVRALDSLPLALTLMGNYLVSPVLSEQPWPLQTVLSQFHDTQQCLRMSLPIAPGKHSASFAEAIPLSLHATIAICDQRLSQQAHDVLCAISIFPSKPNSFSQEAALALSQQSNEVLDELWESGLLENWGPQRYALHQAVVDYARAQSEDMVARQLLVSLSGGVQRHAYSVRAARHSLFPYPSLLDVGIGHMRHGVMFRLDRISRRPLFFISMTLLVTLVIIALLLAFNWLSLPRTVRTTVSPPSSTTPVTTISGTTYEAEAPENTLTGGAIVSDCPACSGGKDVGKLGHAATLQFNNIKKKASGKYRLTIYYVYGIKGSHRNLHVTVNGQRAIIITVVGLDSWNQVGTLIVTVNLNADNNIIIFSNPSGVTPSIDRIVV
jgi:DNA-binding XRE family transcriptional regulator